MRSIQGALGRCFDTVHAHYQRSLDWALAHGPWMLLIMGVTVALNGYLYYAVPKGPEEVLGVVNTQINGLAAAILGGWTDELNVRSVILRILLSVMLAAIIGCERSSKRHSAGLRTFILVSLASTTAMLTDLYLCQSASERFPFMSAAAVIGAAMISGNAILFSSRSPGARRGRPRGCRAR